MYGWAARAYFHFRLSNSFVIRWISMTKHETRTILSLPFQNSPSSSGSQGHYPRVEYLSSAEFSVPSILSRIRLPRAFQIGAKDSVRRTIVGGISARICIAGLASLQPSANMSHLHNNAGSRGPRWGQWARVRFLCRRDYTWTGPGIISPLISRSSYLRRRRRGVSDRRSSASLLRPGVHCFFLSIRLCLWPGIRSADLLRDFCEICLRRDQLFSSTSFHSSLSFEIPQRRKSSAYCLSRFSRF
jgi:hypothetical protein